MIATVDGIRGGFLIGGCERKVLTRSSNMFTPTMQRGETWLPRNLAMPESREKQNERELTP